MPAPKLRGLVRAKLARRGAGPVMGAGMNSALRTRTRQKLTALLRPSALATSSYLDSESALGSQLFGPVPTGVDRKFFHSTEKNVWIWHENGTTIRYEVRPHGVFKRVGSGAFEKLNGSELANFRLAATSYLTSLKTHLYR